MIRDLRRGQYQRLAMAYIVAFLVGSAFGSPWIFIAVLSTGYLAWLLYQQHKLVGWIMSGSRKTPPESHGLWGVIFDHLYRQQREHRRQVNNYRDVIKRIRSSTQALNDGIILLDENGNIQWWNNAAQGLLNLRKTDAGQLLTNLVREPKFIRFYNRQHYRDPITLDNPAQQGKNLQIGMTIFGKGERLLLLRDVTRLEQLEEMRQDFVANASHELKTPLTVLRGHLENILTFSDGLPSGVQRALKSMNSQTLRMTNLVTDLLLLTRLDSESSSDSELINVCELLSQVASDARELSGEQAHIINTHCAEHTYLLGSKRELLAAVNNLVFNAVNYSPAGSCVTIDWKPTEKGAVLSVTDEGVGIDHHHIPRLTERFYRIDKGRSSDKGGTGLGLAIVKHALQHHDARLDIRSKKNSGSTFSCVFPAERIQQQSNHENRLNDSVRT